MAALSFAGYAALFHFEDRGGDVIMPGAFAASLAARRDLPLLWQHQPSRVIGRAFAAEDRRGLRVLALIDDSEAAAAIGPAGVTGLSFGYRVTRAEGSRPRRIHALDISEISLVASPMQPAARVYAVARAG